MQETPNKPLPNLLAPEHLADPYSRYSEMRRERTVQEIAPGEIFAVSRYDDVVFVLKHPELFSSAGFSKALSPDWLPRKSPLGTSMVTKDGNEHARLRALVSRAFAPRRIAEYEPRVRAIAAELADQMLESRDVDFVSVFSSRLPAKVIVEVVGLDPEREADLQRWIPLFEAINIVRPSDEVVAAVGGMLEEVETCFREVIAARRAAPRDDMVTDLVQAEVDGALLTDDELVSFLCTLIVGGIGTTKCLLGNIIVRITSKEGEWARLRSSPEETPRLIDDVLRTEAPGVGVFRVVASDCELGGRRLRAGSLVFALIASANRDTSRSPDATTLQSGSGLTFGHGIHYCLGAALAKLEARVMMEELLSRFAGVERRSAEVQWAPQLIIRGVTSLPVRWIPA